MFLGDYRPGDTIDFTFTTDVDGTLTQLAGTPAVRVYKANGTTEDDSGITLTVDFDSRTGLNHVRIDTSTDGTFYATANDFYVVVTAGTVGGRSVVGYVVAHFSLKNRSVRDIETDTQDIQGRLPAALVSGRIDASVGAMAANVLTASALAADAVTEIQAGLSTLDAAGVRTALGLASANLDTQLSAIDDFLDTEIAAILVDTGTTLDDLVDDLEARLTQALADKLTAHAASVLTLVVDTGSTTTAVVFKTVNGAAASGTDDFYNGAVIVFTSGSLAGQRTSITDYVGATKTATVVALTGAPALDVTAVIV